MTDGPFDVVKSHLDLIYDKQYVPALRKLVPDLVVEDASDFIHEDRVEVHYTGSMRDWFRVLIRTGAAESSFIFQLTLRAPKDGETTALFEDLARELRDGALPALEDKP